MGTINEIEKVLVRGYYDYSIIQYPERNKSIDIIASKINTTLRRSFILKVTSTRYSSHNKLAKDLKKMATLSGALPILIDEQVDEEVINDRDKVLVMSSSTFEKVINGEKIFLLKTRGGVFVKIDSKELKKRREEKGMSLGELAEKLGVSRISIYDYEKEDSYVSIDVAEKLVDIFGEQVLGDIINDFKVTEEKEYEPIVGRENSKGIINLLIKKLSVNGYKIVKFDFTTVDLAASKDDKKMFFCVETEDVSTSLKKFNEANKLVSKVNGELIIVAKTPKTLKTYERESFVVYTLDDIDKIDDEIN
ncbi:helix-turn-helix domain-containing protein [Stygiolobus caldivivus]|uniref:Putative HTH-type transcriptional regulatory protein KN1_24630 n=1 Tax=Stygiolobus caldivivus TaxID=2824673 RepID=A0A8D5U9F0_9CREN|nr:helix-turn-helix domain-containing protein [Stygiolobus caldivivus]BCU71166.1 transcriptional regulator [Stygiolobus caldivivus]